MATYSKLLCEHQIVSGINDKFSANDGLGDDVITLTPGRYRDSIALADEIETQLGTTASNRTWTVSVSNTTGIITIAANGNFNLDFDTSTYGSDLSDRLGFTSTTSFSAVTSASGDVQHSGGLYPSEPIENDSRPSETGTDRHDFDGFQGESRTGLVSTKGGTNKSYFRDIQLLLPSGDLEDFSNFLDYCATGETIAFYHDRAEDWPGPSSEYEEYVLYTGADPLAYDPSEIEPGNKVWFRAELPLRKYVAPTT